MPKRHAQDVRDQIQQRFGETAVNYRRSKAHASGPDLDRMIELSAHTRQATVLDAGCGAGHTAMAFAALADRVIACDFTPAMLQQVETLAREMGVTNVNAQLADVEALPFPSRSFDLVATRYSAHHWLRPQRALAEFRRLLKPDGALLLSDIMAREDFAQDTFLQTIERLRDPSHVRDYRISEWQAMLAAAGFASELVMTFKLTLHFASWTRRMHTPRQNGDMILALFNDASDDIKRAFQLPARVAEPDFKFVIPGAVMRARVARS